MSGFFLIATILFFLGFSGHAFMASLVLQKRNKQAEDFVFFTLLLTASLWYLANLFASLNSQTLEISWNRFINLCFAFSYCLFCFFPALILHLTNYLVAGKKSSPRWIFLSYLPCVPLAVLPMMLGLVPGRFSVIMLIYFLIFLVAYFFIYGAIAWFIIVRREKTMDLMARRGVRRGLQLIGIIILFLFTGGFGIRYYVPGWSYFFLLVKFSILLMTFVISLYLLRYNFMDYFVKKGLVYSILSGLVLLAYLFIVRVGGTYIGETAGIDSTAIEILLLFLLIILFQPLTQYIQQFIDRFFYRERMEYREALRTFSQSLQATSDLTDLCRSVQGEIFKAMKVARGGIGIIHEDRLRIESQARGELPGLEPKLSFLEDLDLSVWDQFQSPTLCEEIPDESLGNELLLAGTRVVIPVRLGQQVLGVIFLGTKRSEEIYFKEDLDLLDAVSGHFALALENLSLIEKKVEMERKVYHTEKLASIGELSASVAHEIRNPMAGIKCLVQQLDEEAPPSGPLKENTETILGEIGRMERIISQLLTFSKQETYSFSEVDLNVLLEESISHLNRTTARADLETTTQFSEVSVQVRADGEKLRQVFSNILVNAADAASTGGQTPRIHLEIDSPSPGKSVTVSIRDNGVGINPEDLGKIFNPFFTRKEKGTGLGLAICKKIIEAHTGDIQIESQPGKGTTVRILLPSWSEKEE